MPPKPKGRPRMSRDSFKKLQERVAALEAGINQNPALVKIQAVEDWVADTFARARWELPSASVLSSVYDQGARRELLGYLHAAVVANEKLGHETPDDIGRMVMALAGRDPAPPPPAGTAVAEPTIVRIPNIAVPGNGRGGATNVLAGAVNTADVLARFNGR